MAVKPATVTVNNFGVCVVTWADLDAADTGQPVLLAQYSDKTVQLVGSASALTIEGSNDGTNWSPLNDAVGPISLSNGEMVAIRENPLYIRPNANDGSNSVVTLVAKATGK